MLITGMRAGYIGMLKKKKPQVQKKNKQRQEADEPNTNTA